MQVPHDNAAGAGVVVGVRACRNLATLTLVVGGASGCISNNLVRDRESTCRVARSALRGNMSPADLVVGSTYYPVANFYARRAYHSRLAVVVVSSIGAAGLVGAFATGFGADTSRPEIRTALYSVVGGTIGLGAGALLAGWLGNKARARAYQELDAETLKDCP